MKYKTSTSVSSKPLPTFTAISSIAVVVGVVVGSGIFRLPPLVAEYSANGFQFIMFWLAGGVISLIGALCYAELSSSNPDSGGEYYFLWKAFGTPVGFLFAWARMTVIQTGSIALVSFILGDYATLIFDLGRFSSSIYAGLTVIVLTLLNVTGTKYSRKTQLIFTSVIVIVLIVLSISGLISGSLASDSIPEHNVDDSVLSAGTAGMAMIFVLLTYGGWNEAAYLSGELLNVRKNIITVLVTGIALITFIYVFVNLAFLKVIGLDDLRTSSTVGADFTSRIFGDTGSVVVSLVVILSALSTINATIITGARTIYALGRDYKMFDILGRWRKNSNAPVNALFTQGAIALLLVFVGAGSKQAVETMVDYTAPVFWFFLFLITTSIFIFRKKNRETEINYKVPFYPITPIIFSLTCLYMFYSSLVFTGIGSLIGVTFLILGIPVYAIALRFK